LRLIKSTNFFKGGRNMAKLQADKVEQDAVRMVAALMAASARTAPKARGADDIQTMVVDGEDLKAIADFMEKQLELHVEGFKNTFIRDAQNLRESACVLLIGCQGMPKGFPDFSEIPLDCGACGYKSCQQMNKARIREGKDFNGPICVMQAVDFGIAIGSAVKMAMDLNVDNRIMYTIGAAARQMKLIDSDIIMGIPLSVQGKNLFFDRKGGGTRALHNK
jgi:uncharacterized ferredoxin-like protein